MNEADKVARALYSYRLQVARRKGIDAARNAYGSTAGGWDAELFLRCERSAWHDALPIGLTIPGSHVWSGVSTEYRPEHLW